MFELAALIGLTKTINNETLKFLVIKNKITYLDSCGSGVYGGLNFVSRYGDMSYTWVKDIPIKVYIWDYYKITTKIQRTFYQ